MSNNIPNLDSFENKSWIAYYDAIDNTSISELKTEQLNNKLSRDHTIESYDDGIVLKYDGPTREEYVLRASTEGWITAHMTVENDYTTTVKTSTEAIDDINGIHDIIEWNSIQTNNVIENVLERLIYNCLRGLDKWEDTVSDEYNSEDVNLYSDKYGSSTNVSVFSESSAGTYKFSFTDDTIIRKIIVTNRGRRGSNSRASASFRINGETIYSESGRNGVHILAFDMTDDYTAGEQMELSISAGRASSNCVNVVAIWE